MGNISDTDQSRRQLLLYLLATGVLTSVTGCGASFPGAEALPAQMPAGRSIYQLAGEVQVNGQRATLQTSIKAGDVVETFADSYIIFVVNEDAFVLRSNGRLNLPAPALTEVPPVFKLESGKLLSVLASRRSRLSTPSAIIAIRGTGLYIEVEPDLSYVCICYGTADLAAAGDPGASQTVVSEHHDAPKFILADRSSGNRIRSAPFRDHDDEELLLIETLVGRTTPYVVPRNITRTRRRHY